MIIVITIPLKIMTQKCGFIAQPEDKIANMDKTTPHNQKAKC